jgi:hypothetical protein
MKHLSISTITIVAVLLFVASLTMTQRSQGNDAAGASSDSAIVDKLREIVTVRQRVADYNKRAVQNGSGARDGRYELALAEARLELARELGERNEQIAALKDILEVQQGRLEDAEKRGDLGAMSPDEVDTNRVAVLEAEVRLLRAQKNSSKP